MSVNVIGAFASVGTFVILATAATAAFIQLQHIRADNQLQALLSLESDFRTAEMQAAICYIQERLADRMEDPRYRAELAGIGFIDTSIHPELIACNWFNEMGALVKNRLVTEDSFMDLFARLILFCWKNVAPAVAVMRRSRGDFQYHDFEYLALRAQSWLERHHPLA